jgi:signal transduction histidine kinase
VLLLDRASSLRASANARAALLQSSSDAVLARIADGVVVTDATGHVRSLNAAAERLIGPRRDRSATTCAGILGLHVDERPLTCDDGCALLSEDDFGTQVWRDCGGRRQPLLADVAAVTDDAGVVVEVVHSLRDITKIKQSEEAKTLFLATASHELKTPLTVIRGFVETMRTGMLDAESSSVALEAVHRRTLELGEIVDRLLLSSRIESGRIDLKPADVDLGALLAERCGAMATARSRTVHLTVDPGLATVVGDATALATVVDHLVDNAIKYSPDGGDVSVRALAGEPVMVTVTDRGVGMDADEAKHCFERFWQAEASDVRRFGGSGIGLYIVRSLVDAMGGSITVQSEKGTGTTFVVELPVAAPDGDATTTARRGEATMIREFMRQIGVPEGAQ